VLTSPRNSNSWNPNLPKHKGNEVKENKKVGMKGKENREREKEREEMNRI
jgi:hypothetical protein